MDILAAKLGSAARTARLAANLTQAEVAEDVGIASEVYGRLERGLSLPRTATLIRLCRTLDVSSDVLLGLERGAPLPSGSGRREMLRLARQLSMMSDRSLKLLRLLLVDLRAQVRPDPVGAR